MRLAPEYLLLLAKQGLSRLESMAKNITQSMGVSIKPFAIQYGIISERPSAHRDYMVTSFKYKEPILKK